MGSQKLRALDPLLHHEIDDLLHKESDFIERFYQLKSVSYDFAVFFLHFFFPLYYNGTYDTTRKNNDV
jgi:hypothetical protein